MNLRKLLATLTLTALALGLAAVEPETKNPAEKPDAGKKAADKPAAKGKPRGQSERTCALTITWWEPPVLAEGEHLDLGVQADNGVIPIWPSAMNPGSTILYEGPATVAIVRKGHIPDPSGKPGAKPIETWLPFVNLNLGPDDRELLAILFAADGTTNKVMARAFNINVENFPFGGFHVYNYTKGPLLCSMAGKTFNAPPNKRTASPVVMTKREVVNFFLGVTDQEGAQKLIFRAPLILNEKIRRLYFVMENPGAEPENRYVTHTMMQHLTGHKSIESLRGQSAAEETPKAPTKKEPAGKKEPATATDGTPKAQ
jgi:hypothetical protein